ncbi:MAG: hypothetical protein JW928_06175, partial [Candidatus Aureabacteria bacterium]|nr:hypothetical protein [Candidatus Auribacterota bacterium]
HKHEEDWGLEDPSGKSLDVFRKVRDEIEEKINDFLDRIFSQGRNA